MLVKLSWPTLGTKTCHTTDFRVVEKIDDTRKGIKFSIADSTVIETFYTDATARDTAYDLILNNYVANVSLTSITTL